MTTTYVTTDMTTGFQVNTSGDTLDVLPTGIITSTSGSGVQGSGPCTIDVWGTIAGINYGIVDEGTSAINYIYIGTSGSVSALNNTTMFGASGIAADGAFYAQNYGTILATGPSGYGFSTEASGTLVNYGAISGSYDALNSSISASADTWTMENYGSLSGGAYAFRGYDESDTFFNAGTINGTMLCGSGANGSLDNTGSIFGSVTLTGTITNAGVITGSLAAGTGSTITDSGTITGGVSANESTINLNGAQINVAGSGDTVAVGAGANNSVTLGGNSASGPIDTVNGSNAIVNVNASSQVQVNGNDDAIAVGAYSNMGVAGANDTVSAQSGDGIYIGGNGVGMASDIVNGASGAAFGVDVGANSDVQFNGSSDTVVVGVDSNLGVAGANDTVNASAGDGVWVSGNGATGALDTVNGSQFGVELGGNSRLQVNGSGDGLVIGDNSNVGVAGSNNRVVVGVDDGLYINSGSGNLVTAGYGDSLSDYGTGSHIDVGIGIGAFNVFNFAADATGVIDLLNGVGGYASAAAAFAAVTSDGSGGEKLALGGGGYIDFVSDASLSASNFKIG